MMQWKPKVHKEFTEGIRQVMKCAIIRHDSLDKVGGSESLSLRLQKMARKW